MEITIVDERPGVSVEAFGRAKFNRPRITVRELIAARVALEVESANDRSIFSGAGPDPLGDRLNGLSQPRQMRIDGFIREAEAGFERGRYFLLAGDRQLESLDEEIDLAGTSEVTFLLLMPLQGG